MTFPFYDSVLKQLDAARGRLPEVAAGSGVPLPTVRKIAQRVSTDPGIKTIEQLAAHFGISYVSRIDPDSPDALDR